MGDPPDIAAHAARVRALPLVQLQKRLLKKAAFWGVDQHTAEDAVQRAILLLVRDGATKWKHEADPTAYRFLRKRMKRAFEAKWEREEAQRTDLDTNAVEESPPSSDAGPRRIVIEREDATKQREELLQRLSDNPLAVKVVELCMREGELFPREIAAALDEPVARVYECNRRIGTEIERMVERHKLARKAEEALG